MKKRLVALIVVLAVVILIMVGYYLISPAFRTIELNDSAPKIIQSDYSGNLIPDAHNVKGMVKIYGSILRFEDFDTINGPDLYIYLSKDTSANEIINLGKIKGTKGNINYDIPLDAKIKDYPYVLVWCKQFSVLFSHAKLE